MKISQIKVDSGLQMRASLDQGVILNYAEALREGAKFPPITVFHDGTSYHLADGWNRLFAHKEAVLEIIDADVREGTRRDAMEFALSANATHGSPRTNADKRKAVMACLDDFEWNDRSDREIAKMCNISHVFVSKIRKSEGKQPDVIKSVQNGKEVPMRSLKKELEDEVQLPVDEKDDVVEELSATVKELAEENERLEARVAVAAMQATDEERASAEALIADLQAQVKTLEADNRVLKASRDSFQAECAQIKKQVGMWKSRCEKYEREMELSK